MAVRWNSLRWWDMFCIFSVPCSSLQLRVARVTEEWNFKLISLTYVFNLNHLLWLAATVLGSIALEWKRSRLAAPAAPPLSWAFEQG